MQRFLSKIGWGEIAFKEKLFAQGVARVDDRVFVVNPAVSVEANMTEWFKINFGLGYQLTNGVDNFYFQKGDFDGLNFNMSFHFGWFR